MITRQMVVNATKNKHSVIRNVPCTVIHRASGECDYRYAFVPNDDKGAFDDIIIRLYDVGGLGKGKQVKSHETWLCNLSFVGFLYSGWESKAVFNAHPKVRVEEG